MSSDDPKIIEPRDGDRTIDAPDEAERKRIHRLYVAVGVGVVLFYASFHPLDLGMLGWVALVPWMFVALTASRREAIAVAYSTTFLYHVLGLSWIALVTAPGWIATSFLEGFYSVAIVLAVRWLRTCGVPVAASLPPLWVMGEHHRGAHLSFIKFPWLFLGHTQHARSNLIQIADVTSVYGLSFLVVLVNAVVLDALLLREERRRAGGDLDEADWRRIGKLALVPAAALLLANTYGLVRTAQVAEAIVPGPRLLAIQVDIPQDVKDSSVSWDEVVNRNFRETRLGLLNLPKAELPDAVIWSETMWPWQLNVDYPRYERFDQANESYYNRLAKLYEEELGRPVDPTWATRQANQVRLKDTELFQFARNFEVDILVGSVDRGPFELQGTRDSVEHNSIFQIGARPDGTVGVKARYDKINLVPASEGIPFKGSLLMGWFYRFIKAFVPEGFITFEAGKGPVLMEVGRGAKKWKLSPDICFEVSFPELIAEGARQGADVLVCPSNDGWFHTRTNQASAEIPLAFDHAQLRAIESRRGMVRVVNRGITCFIDPLGRKTLEVAGTKIVGRGRDIDGEAVRTEYSNVHVEGRILGEVPTTSLGTPYLALGDFFAWGCWLGSLGLIGACWRRKRRAAASAPPSS